MTPYKKSAPQGLSYPPLAARTPPGRHPDTRTPPGHPLSPPPPQKSHVIRLPEKSTPPTNVAIPTILFHSLKGLHGIMCDISGQPPRYPDVTRPRPHPPSPPHPKVARNSATRKFNTAHKRCNPNDLVSKFERFTWNYVRHFRATTPNGAHTRPHTPTRQRSSAPPNLRAPATAPQPRHAHPRAPASSRASTHTPAQ